MLGSLYGSKIKTKINSNSNNNNNNNRDAPNGTSVAIPLL